MNKDQIKADLVAHLREGLLADMAEANAEGAAALVDEQDETRVDDISHEDEAGDLHGLIEKADEREDTAADAAEQLDMSAADVVRPGAVIEMDGQHFVVGIASSAFTSGGVEYSGISTDAPVYETLAGKKAGDTFTFADVEHHIGSVI